MLYTIFKIAQNELTNLFRNKVVLNNGIIIILLLLTAVYGGYKNYRHVHDERTKAQAEKRQQWLNQDPKHPHIAAHFGTFAYKPKTTLSLIDMGLDNYTGSYEYLEPHHQNDFIFKPSEEYSSAIRFGQLSVALVVQLLIPLLIIFMGFSAVTRERENGTLKLLYSHGVSLRQIATGKALGLYAALLLLLVPALLIAGLFFLAQTSHQNESGLPLRGLLMLTFYCLYFLIFTILTVFISAVSKTSRSALLVMLCSWILLCIIIPKTVANIGDNLYPLPSQYAFKEAIQKDITNGIDGHNPRGERAKQIEKQLLATYHVDTVSKLPFNFEGYVMQAGEEYSSKVYDKYFHRLQQTFTSQDKFGRYASVTDPYLAIQDLSMGLASTDIFSHIDFQQHAESYRRSFVQKMNEDMKDHSKFGDWDYKANKKLYASVPDFTYAVPTISTTLSRYRIEILSLFFLLSVVLTLCYFVLNKTSIISAS